MRDQDKDIGMPNSIEYNSPQPNQESSPKLFSAPIISTVADGKRNETSLGNTTLSPTQTLDPHDPHQFNVQQQKHTSGRDPNPDPDPVQLVSATNPDTSNSKTPVPPQLTPPHQVEAQTQPTTSGSNSASLIRYRECLKNHAASRGAHVVDGCGEFMPSGEEGTEAFKCAACECHRNFHRKEIEGESQPTANYYYAYNHNQNSSLRTIIPTNQPPPSLPKLPPQQQQQQHHHRYPHISPSTGGIPPLMMALGGSTGAPAESSSQDLNMFQSYGGAQLTTQPSFSVSKKRFRTKFNREQKNKMHEFAEKLGWKIQKQDEQEVQQFCNEVDVKRQVFKVWMHNKKQAMKKKQL